jgi:hypothetical protein
VGKSTIPAISVRHGFAAGWNRSGWMLMEGLPGVPRSCPYGVEADEVGLKTGMFPGKAGDTRGVPGDDVPCPVNCGRGEHL